MKEKLQNGDEGEINGAEETSSGAGSSHRVRSASFEEGVNDGRETRRGNVREDSGNDSGHNSMMTSELLKRFS